MARNWIEALTGPLEQKRQYRHDRARIEALPAPYAATARAVHRYLMVCGGITDGKTLITMFGDLADLFEQAAADGTPIREIVSDDPVDFAETFARAYRGRQWLDKERVRLVSAVAEAEREEGR